MELRPGARIDSFVLVRPLGAGGMGAVWEADDDAGLRVALKVLPTTGAPPELLERFRREGRAQAAVAGHPNVVRVLGAGEGPGCLYLAQELVRGGDLAGRLEREGPLPPLEAARIVADLARGLAHVHRHGVLHRDLKPANVVFGADGAPRLVDFGVARLEDEQRLTRTGQFVGTPAYASPEQIDGARAAVDERTDVYGLGAVLYHALTGRPPFWADGGAQVMLRVLKDAPTPPEQVAPAVPRALSAVCLRALAKSPAARFGSAAELAAALEAFARDPTPARRGPTRAALAVLLVAFATRGALATRRRARRDAPAEATAGDEAALPAGVLAVEAVECPEPEVPRGLDRVRLVVRTSGPALRVAVTDAASKAVLAAQDVVGGRAALDVPLALPGDHALLVRALGPRDRASAAFGPVAVRRLGLAPIGPASDPWSRVRNVKDGSELVRVPAGSFVMSIDVAPTDIELSGARPGKYRAHRVTLRRPFYVGVTEVTRAQYHAYHRQVFKAAPREETLRQGGLSFTPSRGDEPMAFVSWNDARAYCLWAGLRLPTEAEWEFAGRGPESHEFPWGPVMPAGVPCANMSINTPQGEGANDEYPFHAPVGRYPGGRSWCGTLDQCGNLCEWVADVDGPFTAEPAVDPTGPADGPRRVVKAGCWDHGLAANRLFVRDGWAPDRTSGNVGFRVAADAP